MADYNHGDVYPFQAASAVGAWVPVFQPLASSRDEYVVPAATNSQDIIGLTIATAATYNDPVAVVTRGRAKAIAAASVGAGARVGIASANGALGPLTPSGVSTALGSALGGAGVRFQVGRSLKAYASGDVMTVLLDPAQIV